MQYSVRIGRHNSSANKHSVDMEAAGEFEERQEEEEEEEEEEELPVDEGEGAVLGEDEGGGRRGRR
jgi:hypothetical protein